jgi:hypothetical protein
MTRPENSEIHSWQLIFSVNFYFWSRCGPPLSFLFFFHFFTYLTIWTLISLYCFSTFSSCIIESPFRIVFEIDNFYRPLLILFETPLLVCLIRTNLKVIPVPSDNFKWLEKNGFVNLFPCKYWNTVTKATL